MADFGFDETTTYHYIGTGGRPDPKPRVRDFADVAASSYDYWKSVWGVGGIDFLPNLSTGWDDRPWHDGLEVRGRTVEHFRRICRDARRFADETGVKRVCLAPLHEWGEGSYAEPNGEYGFGMFEAVRDAFCEKPAARRVLREARGRLAAQLHARRHRPRSLSGRRRGWRSRQALQRAAMAVIGRVRP